MDATAAAYTLRRLRERRGWSWSDLARALASCARSSAVPNGSRNACSNSRVRSCGGSGPVGGSLRRLLAEHAVLVQRRRLHDEYVAHGVLHDMAGNRSQALPLARAQPTVADHDEVRRVRADGVEQSLGRVAANEPLLD